eukprot:UN34764
MPGFLGEQSLFRSEFVKPIENSRKASSGSDAQQKGALALEKLHKQVLPFLMRRVKNDVLKELPPKVIQDYYVELTPIQKFLYDAFSKTNDAQQLNDEETGGESKIHIFKALHYMRKLVTHPKLVLTENHHLYPDAMNMLKKNKASVNSALISGKFKALKEILINSGIENDRHDHRY